MSEKEIEDLNEKTDDLFMDIRVKKLKGIDTTELEKQAQSNIDKSRRMREYLEKQQKTNINEAKTMADQSFEVTKRLNKLSNKKYPTEPQPEPEPQPDINTYKCIALKEITNYLWSNKNKGEVVNVVIDLLYSISKSEDIEEIQKLVEMYRRQTGQGKKKRSKTKKKKGGKRSKKHSSKKTKKKRSKK